MRIQSGSGARISSWCRRLLLTNGRYACAHSGSRRTRRSRAGACSSFRSRAACLQPRETSCAAGNGTSDRSARQSAKEPWREKRRHARRLLRFVDGTFLPSAARRSAHRRGECVCWLATRQAHSREPRAQHDRWSDQRARRQWHGRQVPGQARARLAARHSDGFGDSLSKLDRDRPGRRIQNASKLLLSASESFAIFLCEKLTTQEAMLACVNGSGSRLIIDFQL